MQLLLKRNRRSTIMEPQSPTHAVPITEWKEREQLDAKVVNGVQELLLASVSVFF